MYQVINTDNNEVLNEAPTLKGLRNFFTVFDDSKSPPESCPEGKIELTINHAYNGGNGQSTYRLFVPPAVAAEFVRAKDEGDTDKVLGLLWEHDKYLIDEYHNGGDDYEGQCVEVETDGDHATLCTLDIILEAPA